jgi:catechol 2,3-dioxygenase-like lactoylglutathione lyase family enzyme
VLNKENATATVGVRDIGAAQRFYEEVLGLKLEDSEQGVALTYQAGSARLLVYQSEFAGTNRATAVTWEVDNRVEAIVNHLRSKGVKFEHYDMPEMKREGDVHVGSDMKAAWFKDPDGNIHALVGR